MYAVYPPIINLNCSCLFLCFRPFFTTKPGQEISFSLAAKAAAALPASEAQAKEYQKQEAGCGQKEQDPRFLRISHSADI